MDILYFTVLTTVVLVALASLQVVDGVVDRGPQVEQA